jgi:hypothetical protein
MAGQNDGLRIPEQVPAVLLVLRETGGGGCWGVAAERPGLRRRCCQGGFRAAAQGAAAWLAALHRRTSAP